MQEPYIGSTGMLKHYRGVRIIQRNSNRAKPVKAAIMVFDSDVEVLDDQNLTTENIAVATLKTSEWQLALVSVYFEDYKPLEPYLEHLKRILQTLETKYIIIGGDMNAWNTWWGSKSGDHRGAELLYALEEMNVQVLNVGSEPTFETIRGGKLYTSNVDITTCTLEMLERVENWRVRKDINSSDHNAVTFTIAMGKHKGNTTKKSTRKYFTKKADWIIFRDKLKTYLEETGVTASSVQSIRTKEELEEKVGTYTSILKRTCEESIPAIKKSKKTKIPWWSEKLEQLKKDMTTKKRRISCAAPTRRDFVVQSYLEAKQTYEEEAKLAQTQSWKQFCSTQERESLWDGIYRVINSTNSKYEDQLLTKNGQTLSPEESVQLLAETFFPDDKPEEDSEHHINTRQLSEKGVKKTAPDDLPFKDSELTFSMYSFNPKKAPGEDGFTADICTRAIEVNREIFLALINKCLELSHFPIPWKQAYIAVLRKPGRSDYSLPKSHRPIGLLSVLGKIFEKMMVRRLRWHLLPELSARQYGFVPQKCTTDALYDLVTHVRDQISRKKICVMISLDIEGAFDSAWWPAIKVQLHKKGCPSNLFQLVASYFRERKMTLTYNGIQYTKETTKGCVQGSIGGPTFWNVLLDPLLKDIEKSGVHCQAFADDIVLVASGDTALELSTTINVVLAHAYEWGLKNKLKFAPQKTNAMLITNKLKYDTPVIRMGGRDIKFVEEIKILGIIIDKKLTFNNHISYACRKAANIYKYLARTVKATWGLNPEVTRTIYMAVIEPIIMYAASVWAPAATKLLARKHFDTIQRSFAQKIIRAYRTVSTHAAMLLAGLLPLDMKIQEILKLYEAKRGGLVEGLAGDRVLEASVCFLEAPHPARATEIRFECLEDMQPETLQKHELGEIQIYTDGSKIEGKVGAAVSWWRDGIEIRSKKLKLEDYCTVFQAEMFALHTATKMALSEIGKGKSISILSDSRSSLELLKNQTSYHPLTFAIRRNIIQIKEQGGTLNLFWIRAHVGTEGNERADELAKAAALSKKTAADYDKCPPSYVKRTLRLKTMQEWQKRYMETETAEVTKLFLPDVQQAYRFVRCTKPEYKLTQMLTGHGGFASYLHRFKCKDSPACVCDPNKEESIVHLLTECPRYATQRMDIEIKTQYKVTPRNLNDLLVGKNTKDAFLTYSLRIVEDAVKRNKT